MAPVSVGGHPADHQEVCVRFCMPTSRTAIVESPFVVGLEVGRKKIDLSQNSFFCSLKNSHFESEFG